MATTGYDRSQIWLHWIIAVLIIGQFISHDSIEDVWDAFARGQTIEPGPQPHVIGGVLVLVLVAVRLILRRRNGVPPMPDGMSSLWQFAAKAGHIAIYVLMFLVPLSGMAAWFGGVEAAAEIHGPLFVALAVLAIGHAIIALYHHYVIKDGLLARMTRAGSR